MMNVRRQGGNIFNQAKMYPNIAYVISEHKCFISLEQLFTYLFPLKMLATLMSKIKKQYVSQQVTSHFISCY